MLQGLGKLERVSSKFYNGKKVSQSIHVMEVWCQLLRNVISNIVCKIVPQMDE